MKTGVVACRISASTVRILAARSKPDVNWPQTREVLQISFHHRLRCPKMDVRVIYEAPFLNGFNYADYFDFMECYVEYVAGLEHIRSPKVEDCDEDWGVLQDHLKFVIKRTVNKVNFCSSRCACITELLSIHKPYDVSLNCKCLPYREQNQGAPRLV